MAPRVLPPIFTLVYSNSFFVHLITFSFRFGPELLNLERERGRREKEMEISHPGASFSSSRGDSTDFEADLTLSDRLKAFKSSQFDPETYVTTKCRAMSEKEIRHLCSYLVDLKKASAEEMRKSVYANYGAFIRTSREISDLEGQLLSLRNLMTSQATLVHSLAEGVRLQSLATHGSMKEDSFIFEDQELSDTEKYLAQFLENLEVLIAERQIDKVLSALDEGEQIAKEARRNKTLTSSTIIKLKKTITERRQKLADSLAEAACHPSTRSSELRAAVKALKKLGDGPRAHTLLIKSHQQKLNYNLHAIQPSDGGAYTANLAQLVFSTVAQALTDSRAVFGKETAYTSELMTWVVKQAEDFANLIKKHVLGPASAGGNLGIVSECVRICLGHCMVLEASGLSLSPVLMRLFRPFVERGLRMYLRRIEESTAAFATGDDWSLCCASGVGRFMSTASLGSVVASQQKLSRSAHRFNEMAQDLCIDVGALEALQLSDEALEGLVQAFNAYISMLINAMSGTIETDNLEGSMSIIVSIAETEEQQIALLANAVLLAEELLPRAAIKLYSSKQNRTSEQKELKKRLQRFVEQLRDSFCRQHALELIFTEDGGVRLSAQMYLGMDGVSDEPEWFPSLIYQELFMKLTQIASIASEIFVGRERFATVLLMRLTETIILWLSEDPSFWEEIEAGPMPLGPLGLQQFYLDMEFVILFASQGRYLSRKLNQVTKTIIERAIQSVIAAGLDPYSGLPEDDWFAEVAQIAIKMLSGKANFDNVDQELPSPTASVSSRSNF